MGDGQRAWELCREGRGQSCSQGRGPGRHFSCSLHRRLHVLCDTPISQAAFEKSPGKPAYCFLTGSCCFTERALEATPKDSVSATTALHTTPPGGAADDVCTCVCLYTHTCAHMWVHFLCACTCVYKPHLPKVCRQECSLGWRCVTCSWVAGAEGTPLPGPSPSSQCHPPETGTQNPDGRKQACAFMCSTSQGLRQNPESQIPQP